jgi:hypothetical protein
MTVSLRSARDELLHKLPRAGPQIFLKFCQRFKKKNEIHENLKGFTYKNKRKVTLRSAFNEFPLKIP